MGSQTYKLSPQYLGPYKVISLHKNDIEWKHLATDDIKTFHTEDINPYVGNYESALQAAMRDNDQHLLSRINSIVDLKQVVGVI